LKNIAEIYDNRGQLMDFDLIIAAQRLNKSKKTRGGGVD
jgi:hypothetical protein